MKERLNKLNVWKLRRGDKVQLPDGVYTVDNVGHDDLYGAPRIRFSDRPDGHWYVGGPAPSYLLEIKPVVPSTPQTRKVLELLKKGHLTRLTAMHYGVMNLTARISDLRSLGWTVNCTTKRDSEGNRYGDFTLANPQ